MWSTVLMISIFPKSLVSAYYNQQLKARASHRKNKTGGDEPIIEPPKE
jgi:hypothetical protein